MKIKSPKTTTIDNILANDICKFTWAIEDTFKLSLHQTLFWRPDGEGFNILKCWSVLVMRMGENNKPCQNYKQKFE